MGMVIQEKKAQRARRMNQKIQLLGWGGGALESPRDLGCEIPPGLNGDDLRQNAQQ